MGLKSLSDIRNNNSSGPSSSGGLRSLDEIRQSRTESQGQDMMANYENMIADESSYIKPDLPIQETAPETSWNGLLDNPIVRGAETGLSWAIKPFQSVSAGIADTVGAVRNLVGSEKRTGFDGVEYTSNPSQSRNLGSDLKDIWSQTHSDTSSEAWQGAFPNLGRMKGTDVNWSDVLDFGAQSFPLDVSPLLKVARLGLKGSAGARLAGGIENAARTEPLALPLGRGDQRIQSALERSGQVNNDIPMAPGDYAQNALPSPALEAPTIARVGNKSNPYAQKLDELFTAAREESFTPGREREQLDDIWSRMAGPEDPGLDQLIELATPTLKQIERRTPTLEKLQNARSLQQQREVYGVGMPVKSISDRYKVGGVVSEAASPLERIGFKQGNGNVLNIDAVPQPKLIRLSEAAKKDSSLPDGALEWKDKNKLALGRETMQRNFEDIMGPDAPLMKETYLNPVKYSEAERIRFVNDQRKEISNINIKYKSPEDALVQRYGEGKITLDELKMRTPNWKKVVSSAETFRKKYDTYLDTANKALQESGYPPIPKRENYFPHYEEVDGLLAKFGLKLDDYTLPTDLSGRTADLRPGKNFFANALRRKGDKTTFGAIEGFDRYIEGISKLIYQTGNIKRLRGLEKDIRTQFEGDPKLSNFVSELTDYTNVIAGKKAMVDRAFEDRLGRNVYKAIDGVRRRTGANMIGGGISSALTNFIPMTQALATTSKGSFVRGMADTLKNVAKDDGFIQKSDFLTRRFGTNPLSKDAWDKTVDATGWLFRTLDLFSAQTIVRSKYLEGIEKGLKPDAAMKTADDWSARLMADRSVGQMPTLFNSRMLGLVSQFQLEVNNQLSFLFKDIPKNYSAAGATSALGQVFLYSYIFNELYEKVTGSRPAFDPIGIFVKTVQDYTNPELSGTKSTKNLLRNVSNNLPFASTVTGGGRIPINAAIPNVLGVAAGTNDIGEELMKPLYYLLLPAGGGQIKKTIGGVTALDKEDPGVYGKNNKGEEYLKYPIEKSPANITRGALMGPSSFPETVDYYRLDKRALSPEQTKELQRSPNKSREYSNIIRERSLNKVDTEIKEMSKNTQLSPLEKTKKIEDLKKRYKELLK